MTLLSNSEPQKKSVVGTQESQKDEEMEDDSEEEEEKVETEALTSSKPAKSFKDEYVHRAKVFASIYVGNVILTLEVYSTPTDIRRAQVSAITRSCSDCLRLHG